MSKIRITSVPAGQAPEWVREQWVGLEIPIKAIDLNRGVHTGVHGGLAEPENIMGYPVDAMQAVEILAIKSPKAAAWWRENTLLEHMSALVFGKMFCELLE